MIVGLPLDDAAFAESLGAYSVHLSLEFIDRRFVRDAHNRGLRVFVFTVDHPEDIKKMRDLGVDGVFTNYPERVLKDNTVTYAVGWP
jgi:glycerophosphoryl diester phosphodiesterase